MIQGTLLSWPLVAVSLFNTILLLWLGLTLWLNADRRSPGVVITAAGFLLGAALFVCHAALLLSETWQLTRSNTLWLALGSAPAALLPFVWYVVLLWYSGFWTPPGSLLRRRHRPWLWLVSAALVAGFVCLGLLGLPFLPLPWALPAWLWRVRELVKTPLMGIPWVAFAYPLYVLWCVVLSLDALRRPGLSERVLGEAARVRARPWLTAATVLLLLVGGLIAAVVLWTITHTKVGGYYVLTRERLDVIGRFDLAISILIAAVTILLGQAMTAYELFTGRILPRRGLARQWKRAVLLAGGYGVLMGGALVWGMEPVYAILLTALLMTTFVAILSWRSHAEWEQSMRQLRPFVASERWYDSLVASPAAEPRPDPFQVLCENLLDATVAYLIPAGPTAAFVSAQSFPPGRGAAPPDSGALARQMARETRLIVPVAPEQYGGATWAVPLWRERGLIGILLLGGRRQGGLYTQEEIEVARSAGERLIDTAASLALSQRLVQIQRERMAATQILDQRTRRALHDEVLPLIHTALLSIAARDPADPALQHLSDAHGQVSDLLHELPPAVRPEISRLGLIGALRKAVEVEFGPAFDEVTWRCEEDVEARAAALNPLAAETLYFAAREAVRNAAKHGRTGDASARLCLAIGAQVSEGQLQISIEDNGPGLREGEGSGHGLALHSTLMAIAGGSLALETIPGQMTRVQIALPVT